MYNKVIQIGNLTRDNELRYLPSGAGVCKNSIATSHKYKDAQGNQKEEVCFLELSIFGKQSEIFNQYTRKGSKVMVEGRLVFEQWTDQQGNNRSRHSLRVENFKFLDSKSDNQQQYNRNDHQTDVPSYDANSMQPEKKVNPNMPIPEYDIDEDKIPF